MPDRIEEIETLRLDIEMLRTMIDQALDNRAGSDDREDIFLRACAGVLSDRRTRLDALERTTLYVSRGSSDHPLA